MKLTRLFPAMTLALCIALGAMGEANPNTRAGSIELEGTQEAINEALYESPRGYQIWIDTERFAYVEPDEGNDIDAFEPNASDALDGVGLYIYYSEQLDYTLDMARDDVQKVLVENGYTVTEIDTKLLFPDDKSYGFHATKSDVVVDKYIVTAKNGAFYLSLEYPLMAAEGFGARLFHMASTFKPVEVQ